MLASGDTVPLKNDEIQSDKSDVKASSANPSLSTASPLSFGKSSTPTHARVLDASGSLNDVYLCDSHPNAPEINSDSSRDSPAASMTECVQRSASVIYAEFESLIQTHGLSVVERLMPLVVNLLENLDELYKDRSAYQAEVDQLREQCSFTIAELDREKERRKQSELRLLQTEDTFEEERKSFESQVEGLNSACRQAELRFKNAQDQIARLELKESELKKESTRLHDRINELIRSNVELTDQVKYAARQRPPSGRVSVIRLGASVPNPPVESIDPEKEDPSSSNREVMYDATSGGGFGFDEMPCPDDSTCLEDELPDDPSPSPTAESDNRGFAGMRKEIDILIKENMDLVETKNALNIVKDDLIAKIDALTMENVSLKESVSQLTEVRSGLQSELASTDQMLSDARTEIDSLRERIADMSRQLEEEGGSTHRKRFTRAEMSRVLSERNQYKERLIELQEAVRLSDALRAGQKGHPELLEGLNPIRLRGFSAQMAVNSTSTATRPFQTLQNLFRSLYGYQPKNS